MRLSRLASTAALAAALSLAVAHPASANVAVDATIDDGSSDLRPLSVTAQGNVLTRNADGTRNIAYGCVSNGAGDIVAINVRCVIRVDGANVSEAETTLPGAGGAASAAANAALSVPNGTTYQVCFRATGYYINGDRKDLNSKCVLIPTYV
jgi:hypothetical protein